MRLKQEDYAFEASLDKIVVAGLNNRLEINRNVDVQLINEFSDVCNACVYIYVCVCECVYMCVHKCSVTRG